MKKVEIDMTKSEVFNIIGTSYDVIAASQTPEDNLEILGFSGMNSGYYSVYFLDEKLVE